MHQSIIDLTSKIALEIVIFILGGVLGAYLKIILDYKKEVLSKLWDKRYEQYQKVWEITNILPKYPVNEEVTYQQLKDTTSSLKKWYFSNGGILMSSETRNAFFAIQEMLTQIPETMLSQKIYVIPDNDGTDNQYERMRKVFSKFRTKLTEDLSSRGRSILSNNTGNV